MIKHPVTPPRELVEQLRKLPTLEIITKAYQAGADQELEACCEWLSTYGHAYEIGLRAARRPKPPSPKEKALKVLEALIEWQRINDPEYQALRHALEQLPND